MIFPCQKEKSFSISCWESCFSQQGKHEADLFKAAFLAKSCFACSLWCSLMPWANMNGRKMGGMVIESCRGRKGFLWSVKKTCSYCYKTHTIFLKKGSLKKKSCIWITIQNKKIEVFNPSIPQFCCQKKKLPTKQLLGPTSYQATPDGLLNLLAARIAQIWQGVLRPNFFSVRLPYKWGTQRR